MTKQKIIEILKGLWMIEEERHKNFNWVDGYNQAVREQNAKIKAVINKLERGNDGKTKLLQMQIS